MIIILAGVGAEPLGHGLLARAARRVECVCLPRLMAAFWPPAARGARSTSVCSVGATGCWSREEEEEQGGRGGGRGGRFIQS